MPVIARFNGIVIRMYFLPKEDQIPHVHVKYGNYEAAISIQGRKCLVGGLPADIFKQVDEWLDKNESKLLTMWQNQKIEKI